MPFFVSLLQNRAIVPLYAVWLLSLSLTDFVLCFLDKRRARRGAWRIPEKRLLLIACVGGAPGLWAGMRLFRHKTRHLAFTLTAPVFTILHTGLFLFAAAWPRLMI